MKSVIVWAVVVLLLDILRQKKWQRKHGIREYNLVQHPPKNPIKTLGDLGGLWKGIL